MNKMFLSIALFLAIVVCAPGANASSIYNLNVNDGCCGSGPYGTVQLTQNGLNQVDVLVKLANGFNFASFGFGFDLTVGAGTPVVTVSQSSINAGFSSSAFGTSIGQFIPLDGFGSFNYVIGTSGTSQPISQPLSFSVTDSKGISIDNFLHRSAGGDLASFFVADILCTACSSQPIGFVGSDGVPSAAAPEPGPFLLSGLGLGLVGLGRLRLKPAKRSF
jgi:hypothetical protein